MPLEALLTRPMTLVRRVVTGTDDYGNEIWGEERTEITGELQEKSRSEPPLAGELPISEADLFLAPGFTGTLGSGDAVEVDGRSWEFIGKPSLVWNPRLRAVSHIRATVRVAA